MKLLYIFWVPSNCCHSTVIITIKLNDKNNLVQPSCCFAFHILQSYLKKNFLNFKICYHIQCCFPVTSLFVPHTILPNAGIYIRMSTRQVIQNFSKIIHMVKIFSGYSSHFINKFSSLERKEDRLKNVTNETKSPCSLTLPWGMSTTEWSGIR